MSFAQEQRFGDLTVQADDQYVASVTIHRPPDNYFDQALIASLADAYEAIDADPGCRVILLQAEGKHFCAGAQFGGPQGSGGIAVVDGQRHLYDEAVRLFAAATPVVGSPSSNSVSPDAASRTVSSCSSWSRSSSTTSR